MILNFSFVTIMIDPVENLSAFFPERSRRDVAYQHPDDVVQAAAQPRRVHSREERAGRFTQFSFQCSHQATDSHLNEPPRL